MFLTSQKGPHFAGRMKILVLTPSGQDMWRLDLCLKRFPHLQHLAEKENNDSILGNVKVLFARFRI